MSHSDNISNLLPVNDYGIKISKIGFNALTASDKDLIYNSSWPSVQIIKVIECDGVTNKYKHNLTFPPFALLLSPSGGMDNLPVDEINIYSSGAVGDSIIIYNINLTIDVEYPYTTQQSENILYDYDYGIKMVKPDKNINSTDMRDYILHTRCGSPMILAVKTQETVSPNNPTIVQYTNKIGYPTLNFGYVRVSVNNTLGSINYDGNSRYYPAPLQSQAFPWTVTDGIITYESFSNGSPTDGATLVILRNPVISSTNSVSVTY